MARSNRFAIIEIHAPISAIVKAVYVQAGDTVPAGKAADAVG